MNKKAPESQIMAPYQITSAKITSKTMVMICSPMGIGCLSMTARPSVRGSGMLQRAVGSSAQRDPLKMRAGGHWLQAQEGDAKS
ncbi:MULTISPECIES: hypothetical protein [Bradyrhizobium]|uniref:Uncharacterized protein n=1 Tax=Bradyrhizobium elkanii TaxID=29448 RepID=A0A8I1YAC3_BRAEL|nr:MULTISPECIES: hypothetical protein [Bradyrhizobium]MBP1295170.1 hypothetical protein [Bradyrhizobium elkanii]MCP1933930.1 hypothetical protein [Bradyrhizobium elkanii]MCS3478061.1 hypothetical protein [Bradyrhizobium elkanii]MCS3584835.1 hypothetical protein [Bradyrhizobium elkanii]MCS3718410.1 hypothetical protein [Bradyrhizobium elkanii]